jgi:peroxiredoxin
MALVGKPAPHFRLKQLDGTEISDADLHGTVYVLDFWATWCGPCKESLPELDGIYSHVKADGVKIFAVNQQEDAATVKDFIGQTHLSIPVLLDLPGTAGSAYGASAIPQTVIVGSDGTVKNVFIGSGNDQNIAAAIQAALRTSVQGQ